MPKLLVILFRFIEICARAVNDFLGKNGPQLAASVSYYALFSLFPLALGIIFVLSFFLGHDSIDSLAQSAAEQAPISQETVSDVLASTLHSRSIAGLVGLIGLLWAGTAVFGAIRKGVNATWGITKPRPFFQERIMDLSLMAGATVLLLVSISSTAVLSNLKEILEFVTMETHVNGEFLWDWIGSLIPPVLSFISFISIYIFLPNTRVNAREALPGAIAATISFEILKGIFVWYVSSYSTYSSVYGPIGSIVALMMWVYLSANILLLGSLITHRYASYLAEKRAKEEALMVYSSSEPVLEPVPVPVVRRPRRENPPSNLSP